MESTYKPTRPQFPDLAVYALHAGDLRYMYVGTSKNVRQRLNEHRSRARRGHRAPVYGWMREVGPELVRVVTLDHVSEESEKEPCEARWVAKLIDLGFPLLNEECRNGVPRSKSARGLLNLEKGQRATPRSAKPCTVYGVSYGSVLAAAQATGVAYSTIRRWIAVGDPRLLAR